MLLDDALHEKKQQLEVLHKKVALKKLAKLTGKHQSLLKKTPYKKRDSHTCVFP